MCINKSFEKESSSSADNQSKVTVEANLLTYDEKDLKQKENEEVDDMLEAMLQQITQVVVDQAVEEVFDSVVDNAIDEPLNKLIQQFVNAKKEETVADKCSVQAIKPFSTFYVTDSADSVESDEKNRIEYPLSAYINNLNSDTEESEEEEFLNKTVIEGKSELVIQMEQANRMEEDEEQQVKSRQARLICLEQIQAEEEEE